MASKVAFDNLGYESTVTFSKPSKREQSSSAISTTQVKCTSGPAVRRSLVYKCLLITTIIILIAVAVGIASWYILNREEDSVAPATDGSFSNWSNFGPCSKTCGGGTMKRKRRCDNPPPGDGGRNCTGSYEQIRLCANFVCPVNGSFSNWSKFGPCSMTCGNGTMIRTRKCENPAPKNGGMNCTGPYEDMKNCTKLSCSKDVNGSFSNWSKFGPCSSTCGNGTMIRTRDCDNPAPKNGGMNCTGPYEDIKNCTKPSCFNVVNGSFSNWSKFGPCSKTCGGGARTRTRQCNNPVPSNGGRNCTGSYLEIELCGANLCPAFSGSSGHSRAQQLVQDILLDFQNTSNPTKPPSAKFQKAIFVMQREAANDLAFQYVRHSSKSSSRKRRSSLETTDETNWRAKTLDQRLTDLTRYTKLAVTSDSIEYGRSAFAKSLIVFIERANRDGTPVNELSEAADGFLQKLKSDIGEKNFSKLMLDNGEATLMFAIDTTGSMAGDIIAAKAVATSIINMEREFPVNYILSPFNDPGAGPAIKMKANEKNKFVAAINDLSATGGGDCPELAFQGMLNALDKEPELGSPMFVFTDASAKDAELIDQLKSYYGNYEPTINFFTKSSGCGSGIRSFQDIASYTSGQIFPLQSDADITQFTDFVGNSLKDTTIISEGRLKQDYYFIIDSEVPELRLALHAERSGTVTSAVLKDPSGVTQTASHTTAFSRIYSIENPAIGQWHLQFPPSSGKNSFMANSVGNNSIQFTPYFLHQENEIEGSPVLSISNPVKGKNASCMLQISGSKLLDQNSVFIDVISESGTTLQHDVKLEKTAGGNGIMKGLITPPNDKFKIAFKGKKKDGQNFTRISQASMKASVLTMLPIGAGDEFTAAVNKTATSILIYVFNNGITENIHFNVSSTKGRTTADKSYVSLAKASNATVSFTHQPQNNATIGKTVAVNIAAIGQISGVKSQLKLTMLYVP